MKKIVLYLLLFIGVINVVFAQERSEPRSQVWIPENIYTPPGSQFNDSWGRVGYILTSSTGAYRWQIWTDDVDFDVSGITFTIGNSPSNPAWLLNGNKYNFSLGFRVPTNAPWGGSCKIYLKILYGLYPPLQEIFEGYYTVYACYPENITTSSVIHDINSEYIAQDYVVFTDGFRYTTNSSSYSLVSYLEDCDYDEEREIENKSLTISNNETDYILKHSMMVDDKMSIYPNPTENGLFIINGIEKPVELTVLNSSGQQIIHKTGVICNNYVVDISNEPPGIYLVRTFSNGEISMQKIIKSN